MNGVEVVAIGARTPVGLRAESTAAAVRARITRLAEFAFVDVEGEPLVVAADSLLEPGLEGRDRIRPMIESVLDEIIDKTGFRAELGVECHVLLTLPEPRPGFSDADAKWIVSATTTHLRAKQLEARVELVGRGHAGSIRVVESVLRQRAQRDDALFLVVGADSYHHVSTFLWLEEHRLLAQAGIRSGFVPGEGAGCLALASPSVRRTLRLRRLAVIAGVGVGVEERLRDSEVGSSGVGMRDAALRALAGLDLPAEAADMVYLDINGERYRSEEWGFVALHVPGGWKSLAYEAASDCWGDVGAAYGPLAGVLAVESFTRGYAAGPRALVLAGSSSGLRGAMLLQAP